MRMRFPKIAKTSKGVLHILLTLGAYAEVETMIREGRLRHPKYDLFGQGYILLSYQRGDLEETLRRCEQMRKTFPRLAEGYSVAAACLARLGRHAEAESVVERGIRMVPNEVELHLEHARLARLRHDWPEALRRWQAVQSRFENHFLCPLGVAESLKEMGHFDEAEKILSEARERFYRVDWLSAEWAEIATARGDFKEAAQRWKALLVRSPGFALASLKGAEALRTIGQEAEADEVLELAVARIKSDLSVHLAYARSADRQGDQAAAAKRWALAHERFPSCDEARRRSAATLTDLGRQAPSLGSPSLDSKWAPAVR